MSAQRSSHTKQDPSSSDWSSCGSSIGGEPPVLVQMNAHDLTVVSLKDNANAIEAACKLDLGKGIFESNVSELDFCTNTLLFDIKNLKEWAKDESSPGVPLDMKLLRPKTRKDPLGTVLIIGSVALHIIMSLPSKYCVANSCIDPTTSQSIS